MPVVPFTTSAPKVPATPKVDDPWLLMAAATMDAQGRLLEPEGTRAAKDVPAEEDTKRDG